MHLHDFNQALLSKAVWRFLVDKDSLCVQAIKAEYRVGRNWFGKTLQKQPLGLGRVSTMPSQLF